jgi:hypothetical protein
MSQTHTFDGNSYRPVQIEAMEGERPYGTAMLRAHASNLQHASKHWGSEFTIRAPMFDADAVYTEGLPATRAHWYASGIVALHGSFLRIPYRAHPRLSKIELTWWCRVSHEVIDQQEANPEVAVDVAARSEPASVLTVPSGRGFQSATFTSRNATDANGDPVSQWFQQTMTLDLKEGALADIVQPRWAWLSLEVQSQWDQDRKQEGPQALEARESQKPDIFWHGSEQEDVADPSFFYYKNAGGGERKQTTARIRSASDRGIETDFNVLSRDDSHSSWIMAHGDYGSLVVSNDIDGYEAEGEYVPYFQWRACHVREKYEPRSFPSAQLASNIPPQSDTPRRHAREAQDMQTRGECIYAEDGPIEIDGMGASAQNFVDALVQFRKWPCRIVVFASFLHSLDLGAFGSSEYEAEEWDQIEDDSPDIGVGWDLRVGPALSGLGSPTSATDKRTKTAYAQAPKGPDQVRRTWEPRHIQVGPPQEGGAADPDFGGEAVQRYDNRKIRLDLSDNGDIDWRVPQRLELDAQITQGPDYPEGTPLPTFRGADDVRTTLYHLSAWSVPL